MTVCVCVCDYLRERERSTAVEVGEDPGNEGFFSCWTPTLIFLLACLFSVGFRVWLGFRVLVKGLGFRVRVWIFRFS
jgi:hypothetical protein